MAFKLGNHACIDPRALYRQCMEHQWRTDQFFGKCNVYTLPRGLRPGKATLLMLRGQLGEFLTSSRMATQAPSSYASQALKNGALDLDKYHDLTIFSHWRDPKRAPFKRVLRKMTITKMDCCLPGYDDDPNAPYVVEVHDRRWHLWHRSQPVGRSYNVRQPSQYAYSEETLNGSSVWTWSQLAQDLWDKMMQVADQAVEFPGLPFEPHGVPENFCYHTIPAAQALEHLLTRLACAVHYDPVLDTFRIVRLGSTDKTAENLVNNARPRLIWTDDPRESVTIRYPERIKVHFYGSPIADDETVICAWSEQFLYGSGSGSSGAPVNNRGTYIVLHDDLVANISGLTALNQATLDTRAAERVADWLRKRSLSDRPVLNVYSGVMDFWRVPGSLFHSVTWEDRGDGFKTVIRASPDESLERWRRNCDFYPCVSDADSDSEAGSGSGSSGSGNYVDVVTNVCLTVTSGSGSAAGSYLSGGGGTPP